MANLSELGYVWPECDTAALGASGQFGETLLAALNPLLANFNAPSRQVLCASILPNVVPSPQRMNIAIGKANPETDRLYKKGVSFKGVQTRVLITKPVRPGESEKEIILVPNGDNVIARPAHSELGLNIAVRPLLENEKLMAGVFMTRIVRPVLQNASEYFDATIRWQGLFYLYDMIMLEENEV